MGLQVRLMQPEKGDPEGKYRVAIISLKSTAAAQQCIDALNNTELLVCASSACLNECMRVRV